MATNEFLNLLRQTKEFDDLEVKIVEALLKLQNRNVPRASANQIADEAEMSVTNAYKYLYSLQSKGIVESMTDKNKVFWLARSANPFPRLFSSITKQLFDKKETFNQLKQIYEGLIDTDLVWFGEKMYQQYEGNFANKAAFLIDIAKKEILITTNKFYDDIVLLDAIKRAIERKVKIKIIADTLHPDEAERLSRIGIDIRFGNAWPYIIVVDENHGITVDKSERGLWFLNCATDYKGKFEEKWEKAQELKAPKK